MAIKKHFNLKKISVPLIIMAALWAAGIVLWLTTEKIFYLVNFIYIGTSIGFGISLYILLPKKKKAVGRRVSQFLVGSYMLFFLGFIQFENMQIEGFFFYLFLGIFAGAAIHYIVGKVLGPLIFSRGWCGWACWTVMILDLLPFKKSKGRKKGLGYLRYAHFLLSLGLVIALWFTFTCSDVYVGINELYWLIGGNIIYYAIGISLAFILKDNRAFCKYVCPITVFLKPASKFSLIKIKTDKKKCKLCVACEKACPMDIKITEYIKKNKRVLSSECILCNDCINACPEGALDNSFAFDFSPKEEINFINKEKDS
jgi:ferredoxin-type protein NapH